MGRVSQAQAQENRRRIVATAARLFRERGIGGVSVADVMAEVGLTHGGFYKQFASKEALVAEAVGLAFRQQAERLPETGDEAGRRAFLDDYLTAAHRDAPGLGCPSAGFGGDLAHAATGGPGAAGAAGPAGPAAEDEARAAYARGVETYARRLGRDGEPDLAAVSTMVGAIILARATAGTELSDRILAAARARIE